MTTQGATAQAQPRRNSGGQRQRKPVSNDPTIDPELARSYLKSVLEILSIDGSVKDADLLQPENLDGASHQALMGAIRAVLAAGEQVNEHSVAAHMERHGVHPRSIKNALEDLKGADIVFGVGPLAKRIRMQASCRTAREGLILAAEAVGRGDIDTARDLIAATEPYLDGSDAAGFEWRDAGEIFEPLPPVPWVCKGLQLGPGRPAMFNAYGSGLKTFAAQALGMAAASGQPVWGRFDCQRGKVLHIDYEQGFAATARRYQRLAIGMDVDHADVQDTLRLVSFPRRYLTDTDTVDVLSRECEGALLVIVDSLRAACPGVEENSSEIRIYLDNLTRVSERTGATFVVIHHASKPNQNGGDARHAVRGSGAIFDACGCVLSLSNQGKDQPRLVQQIKPPADAQGAGVDDFQLTVEDVDDGVSQYAGVRVLYQPVEPPDPYAIAADKYERDAERLLDIIRAKPGLSQNQIIIKAGMGRTRATQVLAALADESRVQVFRGERSAKTYRVNA